MAKLTVVGGGQPSCPGCGEVMHYTAWFLDSRRRTRYDGSGSSSGPDVAAFQLQHVACREPTVSLLGAGVVVTDRRAVRGNSSDR